MFMHAILSYNSDPTFSSLAIKLDMQYSEMLVPVSSTTHNVHICHCQQLTPEDPPILQAIGLCHHLNGSLNSALEAYTEALGLDPVFLEALVGRGDVYMDKCTDGDRERARADYCKVRGSTYTCMLHSHHHYYNLSVCRRGA